MTEKEKEFYKLFIEFFGDYSEDENAEKIKNNKAE